MVEIPFNIPHCTGKEMLYINDVIARKRFIGDGDYGKKCEKWLKKTTGSRRAFLAPSGTAALDMMLLLADIGPGDEVILPSYTFSSTANAVVLRGATPVFIDVRPESANMDVETVQMALTPRTRAILPVHYAGNACDMDAIMAVAKEHDLLVLEDAAQCMLSYYDGHHLGSIGNMGILSFHGTKNVHCGEGGALLVNDGRFEERACIVREKGTDRSKFLKGEVDKYTWVDVGSSYLVNEISAAFLWAQLQEASMLTEHRVALWNTYHDALRPFEEARIVRRPVIGEKNRHNAHIYPLFFRTEEARDFAMNAMKQRGVQCLAHYMPLHSSRAGQRFACSVPGKLPVSDIIARTMMRLPLYEGLDVQDVIVPLRHILGEMAP